MIITLAVVQVGQSPFWIALVVSVALAAMAAMALTALVGWAGQAALLTAGLLLVGGYCTVVIPAEVPGSLLWTLALAALVGAAVGFIASLPSRRLVGLYLLLSTLALQFVITDVASHIQSVTGKTAGYSPDAPNLFFFTVSTQPQWLWVTGIGVVLVYLYLGHLRRTRVGRAMVVIRDDVGAAGVAGVRTYAHLIWAFMITSGISSMAGALAAFYAQNISFSGFDIFLSVSYFVMIILGKPGSLRGAILGAAFVVGLPQVLPLWGGSLYQSVKFPYVEQIVYGVIGFIVLVFRFRGLAPLRRLLLTYLRRAAHLSGIRRQPAPTPAEKDVVSAELQMPSAPFAGGALIPNDSASPDSESVSHRLEVKDARVSFGAAVDAVRGISLTVGSGECLCLVGPNGAGKTSVLNAVVGFPSGSMGRLTRGEVILYDGKSNGGAVVLNKRSAEHRARLGIAFIQADDKVFNELSVREHIRLAGQYLGSNAQHEEELLEVFPDVRKTLDRRAGLLSGGERQQLALMCALLRRPALLVADELSLGLSPAATERLIEALLQIKSSGVTSMMLAEQNVTVAFAVAERVAVLNAGVVKAIGTPSAEYEELVRLAYIGVDSDVALPNGA